MKKVKIFKKVYQKIPFKKELFILLRYIFIPPYKVRQHLFFKGSFKVKIKNKEFLFNHYNNHGFPLENELFWLGINGFKEKKSIDIWATLSQKSDVIFDIGANTGLYSLVSKAVNPSAKVFGFEPIDRIFLKYKNNCELNRYNIQYENLALSDTAGYAVIYDIPIENAYSSTLNKDFSLSNHPDRTETKIKTDTLESYIERNRIEKIDLMKIDVETHEPEVLEGMGVYLQKFQPTLLIEILNDKVACRVEELLKGIDYLFFNMDELDLPERVDKLGKSKVFNFLICKFEVAKELNLIK